MICPAPGGIAKETCYYRLEITDDLGDDRYIGRVSKDVVEKNRHRWLIPDNYDLEDYPFHRYVFHVRHTLAGQRLMVNKDYDLQNVPGEYYLRPTPQEMK
jgi:hypothetical protein